MQRVETISLPGVGVLRTFLTATDDWIGVLELSSGTRQLFVDDPSDPDTRTLAAELQPEDCRILAQLLGFEDTAGPSPQADSALVDWVQIDPGGPAADTTVADLGLRSRTGASIVAVLRDRTYTDITPSFRLHPGDIVVLTGGPPALADAAALLRPSSGQSDMLEDSAGS